MAVVLRDLQELSRKIRFGIGFEKGETWFCVLGDFLIVTISFLCLLVFFFWGGLKQIQGKEQYVFKVFDEDVDEDEKHSLIFFVINSRHFHHIIRLIV